MQFPVVFCYGIIEPIASKKYTKGKQNWKGMIQIMKHKKKKQKAIILIGFMGSGKTTIGIRLSYRLRRTIKDTDKIIEAREGRTISEIFATEGEAYFREQETRLLQEFVEKGYRQILSVGGGTPVKEKNRQLLKKIGIVVYLRIQPQTVYERLKEDHTRPLLQGEDPLGKITNLMEQRKEAYEAGADVIIDVDDLDMEVIIEQIIEAFTKKGK